MILKDFHFNLCKHGPLADPSEHIQKKLLCRKERTIQIFTKDSTNKTPKGKPWMTYSKYQRILHIDLSFQAHSGQSLPLFLSSSFPSFFSYVFTVSYGKLLALSTITELALLGPIQFWSWRIQRKSRLALSKHSGSSFSGKWCLSCIHLLPSTL